MIQELSTFHSWCIGISVSKCNLPSRLKEHRAHSRRGDFGKSTIIKHSHIKDHQIDWQAAQLITPIDAWHPDASERPSRSSNTTLCHRTSAFSSATFGDQYYRLKDLLYPKSITHTRLRDRLYPKSTTLLPLCLLGGWVGGPNTYWYCSGFFFLLLLPNKTCPETNT